MPFLCDHETGYFSNLDIYLGFQISARGARQGEKPTEKVVVHDGLDQLQVGVGPLLHVLCLCPDKVLPFAHVTNHQRIRHSASLQKQIQSLQRSGKAGLEASGDSNHKVPVASLSFTDAPGL